MLIRRDKDNAIFGYLGFSLLTYYYPPTGKNIYLVFPRVLVRRSGAARLNIKDAHTEIWRSLIGTDNLTLDYPG